MTHNRPLPINLRSAGSPLHTVTHPATLPEDLGMSGLDPLHTSDPQAHKRIAFPRPRIWLTAWSVAVISIAAGHSTPATGGHHQGRVGRS